MQLAVLKMIENYTKSVNFDKKIFIGLQFYFAAAIVLIMFMLQNNVFSSVTVPLGKS
jgi:hypothetical protein